MGVRGRECGDGDGVLMGTMETSSKWKCTRCIQWMPWCSRKMVGAAVVVNGGREWWFGGGRVGRLDLQVELRPFPRFLEQRNSTYCAARGASETFGIDSASVKAVSFKFLW